MPVITPAAQAANVVISNVRTDVQGNDVIVSWTTNERTNGCVQFGLTSDYDYQICSVVEPTYEHRLLMQNLHPETVYNFRVTSRTSFGDESTSFNNTVKTGSEADTTAPQFGNITLEYVGAKAVLIRWETNEETTTKVEYGVGYAFNKHYYSGRLTKKHEAIITRLNPSTLYSYRISGQDADKNSSTSGHQQFRTHHNNAIDTNPLEITAVRPASTNDLFVGEKRATVAWTSSRPAKASVYYGTNPKRLNNKVAASEYRTRHEVPLEGLTPGTTYYFRIDTYDIFRNRSYTPSKDGNFSFTTKGRIASIVPTQTRPTTQSSAYDNIQPSRLTELHVRKSSAPKVLGAFTHRFTPATALVQSLHESGVYAIVNNQRHKIVNQAVMSSYGYQWGDVKRVPQAEVNKHKIARLMKTPDKATVYYVYAEKGIKIAIPSESVFTSYPSNRWGDIITVSPEDMKNYKDATLVKAIGNDQTYLLQNGKRRLIANPEAFTKYNYTFENVVTINQKHLMSYPVGDAIK